MPTLGAKRAKDQIDEAVGDDDGVVLDDDVAKRSAKNIWKEGTHPSIGQWQGSVLHRRACSATCFSL